MITLNDFSKKALRRVSPIYENSDFVQHFFNSVGVDYEFIRKYFRTFREQFFIDTVTWGIALQEIKYSLDIREDLTLAQRRQRLGIKAQIHRPLNPARLERAIFEYFGIKTYLSEKEAGFIRIFLHKVTQDSYNEMIKFLVDEKPAHLMLATTYHLIEYIGGGKRRDENPLVHNSSLPLPKTPEQKKNFPKLFVGIAQGISGETTIIPPRPTNEIMRVKAGVAQLKSGFVQINPSQMSDQKMILHAGICMNIGGEIIIDTEYTMPPPIARENPTARLAIPGTRQVSLTPSSAPVLLRRKLRAGLLGADDSEKVNLSSTFGAIARGAINFVPPDDDLSTLGYNQLKIFFDFNISRHRRHRGILLNNIREDLTAEEIRDVADFAVDNELIMNEAGETATHVRKIALKTKTKSKVF